MGGEGDLAAVRLACWIPLSDVDETTGALQVMPGEWHEPLPHHPGDDGRFTIAEADLPSRPTMAVPLRRGDVLLLDRFTPHRALPVGNGKVRWAVAVWVKAVEPGGSC